MKSLCLKSLMIITLNVVAELPSYASIENLKNFYALFELFSRVSLLPWALFGFHLVKNGSTLVLISLKENCSGKIKLRFQNVLKTQFPVSIVVSFQLSSRDKYCLHSPSLFFESMLFHLNKNYLYLEWVKMVICSLRKIILFFILIS